MRVVQVLNENKFYVRTDFVDDLLENHIITDAPKGFYKPKWTSAEWIEGATQDYIDSIINSPQPLSEFEKLRLEQAQANSELVQLITMMGGA